MDPHPPHAYDDFPLVEKAECNADRREIVRIPPPIPSPYLLDAGELPDSLAAAAMNLAELPASLERRITAEIYSLAASIRFHRETYQTANSVEIIPGMGSDRRVLPIID